MTDEERGRWLPGAVWLAGQSLVLLAITVWLLVRQVTGAHGSDGRGYGVAAVALCGALGAGALAAALSRHKALAKTPTLLWHGLLVPIGASIIGSGASLIGGIVIAVGVIGFVAGLLVPRLELDDDEAG